MRIVFLGAAALLLMASAGTPDPVLDFEKAGVWVTEAPLTAMFPESVLRSAGKTPYATLSGGLAISSEHVHSGAHSGKWARTNHYPSVVAREAGGDWSACRAVSLWAWSESATSQTLCVAVYADAPETPARDFYYTFFAVDWTGWKQLRFPRESFGEHGSPVGWGRVRGVGFHAKAFDLRPNPYTVLHLDGMEVER